MTSVFSAPTSSAVTRRAGVGLILLLTAGCTGPDRPDPSANPAEPPASTVIVVDPSLGSDLAVQDLKPDLTLGMSLQGEFDSFGEIGDLAADINRNIYVVDRRSKIVRVFDSTGVYVRSIGRRGGGPGEYSFPNGLIVGSDSVYILDDRVHVFDTTGRYVRTLKPIVTGHLVGASNEEVTVFRYRNGRDANNIRDDTISFWVMTDSTEISLMHRIPRRHYKYGMAAFPPVLSPGVVFAGSERGELYYVEGDTFHISVRSTTGSLVRTYLTSVPKVPTTDTDLTDYRNSNIRDTKEVVKVDIDPPHYGKVGPVPEFRPVIGQLFVSSSGSMLLSRLDVAERPYDRFGERRREWIILAQDGKAVARILLPNSLQVRHFDGCSIYGADGRQNIPRVERYTFETPNKC